MQRLIQRSSVSVAALALAAVLLVVASPADAGIVGVSAYNTASNYGEFTYDGGNSTYYLYSPISESQYNYNVSGSAYVSGSYNYLPYYPALSTSAQGYNGTDYSTYIYASSYASAYADPNSYYAGYAVATASATSSVTFTLTAQSTADLYLTAYASTNYVDGSGYDEATVTAYLYNYATNTYQNFYSATVTNGQVYSDSSTISLTLDAGEYRLGYTNSYAYGYSYNGYGYTAGEYASGTAYLYNIQEVPVNIEAASAPEPASIAIWSLAVCLGGISGRLKRCAIRLPV